jgi:hypothetical protein
MEGFGVKQIMHQLKEAEMTVKQVVHDKDASTMTQVMTVFEDVEECLCLSKVLLIYLISIAHGCKNFRKQIEKLSKKHKELKNIARRASRTMKQIILQSMTDATVFKEMAEQKLDHYCGFHSRCEDKRFCLQLVHIKDPEARKDFMVTYS